MAEIWTFYYILNEELPFSSQKPVAKLSSSRTWIQRLFFHLFNLGFAQLSLYPFSAASFRSERDYSGMLCMGDPSDLQITPFSLVCASTRCSIPSLRWRTGPLEPVMQVHQEFPSWNQSFLCLLLLLKQFLMFSALLGDQKFIQYLHWTTIKHS